MFCSMNSIEHLDVLKECHPIDKNVHLFFLEGNIGAGKSTVLDHLKKTHNDVVCVTEPVDVWTSIKDEDGVDLLSRFYQDPKRWAFTFQLVAFVTRLQRLTDTIQSVPADSVVLMERSIMSDKNCFASHGLQNKTISQMEWKIYLMWFDWFHRQIPQLKNAKFIYLKSSPAVAHGRIGMRNRTGESSIPLTYLKSISELHDTWLSKPAVSVIDVDSIDSAEVSKQVGELLDKVSG